MEKRRFQTGNVILISVAHMLHDIYSSFLAPILPLLIEKFALTYAMAGLLSLLQRLPALLNPFVGIIADRIAMRYLVIVSPAVTAIAMSLLGLAPSLTVLAILLMVMGVSSALFHVPTPVMIRKVSGDKVGKGMSFYMFGGEIARTIGPLIILAAVSLWGLEGTYKLIPFGLAASLVLFFKLRNIKISQDFHEREEQKGILKVLVKYLPLFIILIGITFFRAVMRAALTTFLPTYITEMGQSWIVGGYYLSILELAGAIGTLFWGSYSDKIGRKSALLIIAIVSPVLMYLFVEVKGIFNIPLLILLGFFLLGTTPILLALVQDRAKERPAFMNGIFMSISFGTSALAVVLFGLIADRTGLEEAFKITAYIALGAIPFILFIKKM